MLQSNSLVGFGAGNTVTPEVAQFLARATGMNAAHVTAFTNLINGLVTDGVWSVLDVLYILATDTEANAKINLKSSSYTLTETGTVTWAADTGYTGTNGSTTNYLDSGFNPTTAGGNFSLNSASISVWSNTNAATDRPVIGQWDSSTEAEMFLSYGGGTLYGRLNNAINTGESAANSNSTGFYTNTRTGSAVQVVYKNGSSLVSGTTTSSSMINNTVAIAGTNGVGSGIQSCGNQLSAAAIGGGLDATKALALYNRIATYRTAVGL